MSFEGAARTATTTAFLFLASSLATAAPGAFFGAYLKAEPNGSRGALVSAIVPGTPAGVAGLREGDRVVSCQGQPTPNASALADLLVRAYPGDELRLEVRRPPRAGGRRPSRAHGHAGDVG